MHEGQWHAYQRRSEVGSCTPKRLVSYSQELCPLAHLRIPNNSPSQGSMMRLEMMHVSSSVSHRNA